MCWHPWDLGGESSFGGVQSAHGVSAGPAFFSPFLGRKGISHLVYLKAGVPRSLSMPHAWIPGPTDIRQGTVSKSRGTGGWTGSPSPCVQLSAGVAGNSHVNGAAGLPPPTPGPPAPRWCIPAQGCGRGRERLYSSYWMFWGQMRKRGLGPLLRGISSPCKLLTCYQNHCGVSTIQEAGDSSSRI